MKKSKKLKKKNRIKVPIIAICIAVILISLIIIFIPKDFFKNIFVHKYKVQDGVEIVTSNTKEEQEISEKDAKKLALKQFKKLGENKLKVDDINIRKIRRSNELYYYATTSKNTLEIRIKGGQITRINSVTIL